MKKGAGKVSLVGAGPGDPGLITRRACALLARADVVVYDYLVHPDLIAGCRKDCELIYVGKKAGFHSIEQERIEEILIEKVRAGLEVVRLKGGDPFVYGRGGEEARRLRDHGIPFEIVPGVTAAVAAAGYAGIPLTQRNTSSSVVFLTGHEDPEKKRSTVDWRAYGALDATLCIYMGMGRLPQITAELIAGGRSPDTPAAVVRWASLNRQRTCRAPLGELADKVAAEGLGAPAVVIVGDVVTAGEGLDWFESRPLFGRRVVVTRNRAQAGELRGQLEDLGAEVLEIPLVRVSADHDERIWKEILEELGAYDWLVFSSANGVKHFFEYFLRRHPDVRDLGSMRIAAVGKATARALEGYLLKAELVPETATGEALADALIGTGSLDSAKVLVVTGNRGGEKLIGRLEKEGFAIVDRLSVYKTELQPLEDLPEARDFREHGADYIIFTSSSAVQSFAEQAAALKLQPAAPSPLACSIGPVTSEKLKSYGITVHVEPGEQNLPALVEAIRAHARRDSE